MSTRQPAVYVQYRYDPLDRLTSHSQSDEPAHQRFYCKTRLATEIQGELHRSIVQYDDQLLAQQARQGDDRDTTLLSTDLQRSVLHRLKGNQPPHPSVYTAYGHRAENALTCLLGFNGERPEPVTGHYLLGNGYRAFNPVLMRFNSPDSWSPFGKGGINPYAYCLGDPINGYDQTGHFPQFIKEGISAWKNLAISKVAAAKARELWQVTKTRSVEVDPSLPGVAYKLKSNVAPQDAIKARNSLLDIEHSPKNRKYTRDLNNEREMAEMVKKDGLKVPAEVMDRYHMLEYIKSDKLSAGMAFDSNKLYSQKGPFVKARQEYRASLAHYRDPTHQVMTAHANKIRNQHFENDLYRAPQSR
ncbi:RHS repeat-associated core domain-containing protein [Pseudomonas sp. Sample_10]|uniref:RHS repeat-associated core domain-containing protein n=1 Tax=Pseudomonas sp. Sample_10 TaxID=2448269 RepID=UPI001035F51F|nr:RHS repeat-associated core domain-containing protein [Pseudomonas sp. Sample_10]